MESFRASTGSEMCTHCGSRVPLNPKNAKVQNGKYVLYCPACHHKLTKFIHIFQVKSAPAGTKIRMSKKTRLALRGGEGVVKVEGRAIVHSKPNVKLSRGMKKKYRKVLDRT